MKRNRMTQYGRDKIVVKPDVKDIKGHKPSHVYLDEVTQKKDKSWMIPVLVILFGLIAIGVITLSFNKADDPNVIKKLTQEPK